MPSRRDQIRMTDAEIEAVGFAWGVNYWYSDSGGLHAQRPDGAREIYKHQCATIGGVGVGTYRIDYDDDPAGATSRANLTANWQVTGGVQQARAVDVVDAESYTSASAGQSVVHLSQASVEHMDNAPASVQVKPAHERI